MSDSTIIAWTEHTWNPWRGCDKISPGCAHCYMFTAQRRAGFDPEVVVKTQKWREPHKWERAAAAEQRRALVFTCSWSDWFHETADQWRDEAWAVIRACPHLHFQILTKRHERIVEHLPADWGPHGYPNVWLGVSIENDRYVHRADTLRQVPAVVRFISAEPLLGPLPQLNLLHIDWLIVGGESGPGYRPMNIDWVRQLRTQAKAAKTAFFFKQSAAPRTEMGIRLDGQIVREYPTPRRVTQAQRGLF
jgi:protein gp37